MRECHKIPFIITICIKISFLVITIFIVLLLDKLTVNKTFPDRKPQLKI